MIAFKDYDYSIQLSVMRYRLVLRHEVLIGEKGRVVFESGLRTWIVMCEASVSGFSGEIIV